MLRDKFDFSQRETLFLSSLAIIDRDSYDDAAKSASLKGVIPDVGLFKGSYTEFEKKRERLFQLNSLDMNRFRSTLISAVWLGDNGYNALTACFDAVLNTGDGFKVLKRIGGPSRASVQFAWTSPLKNEDTIELYDSTLENGTVIDKEVPDGKLFKPADRSWRYRHTPFRHDRDPLVVGKASTPIVIIRKKAEEPIFITVTTSLDRQPGEIRINPPLQEKPIWWRFVEVETDSKGVEREHYYNKDVRGFQWNDYISAPDGYVFLENPRFSHHGGAGNVFACDLDVKQTTIHCSGETSANPHYLDVWYTLGKPTVKCIMHCEGATTPPAAFAER